MEEITGIIRKVRGGWALFSHKGRILFKRKSKEAVVKREQEINFFKHKASGARKRPDSKTMDEHKNSSMKRGKRGSDSRKRSSLKMKKSTY